jgi:hypothetical protein
MGVPGIVTLPIRLAINKYGADAVNAYLGRLNQEMVGKAGGVDTSTTEGIASAASQIDQVRDRGDSKPAASAGAIGTGSIAAQASSAVSDALRGTGLSDDQIGTLSQRAADAVVSGIDMNMAVNNAKTAAVDAIQATEAGSYMSKEEISNAVFGRQESVASTPIEVETSQSFEFTSDDALFGDFWGTMEEEETEEDDSGFFGNSGPTYVREPAFKKKFTQQG